MAEYPVPQFIESEGKIIFFLTFRQFFVLVGGGAVCVILYFILPFFLFVICLILITLLVGIIAFLKINDTSVVTVFLNLIGFLTRGKNYTWKKKESAHPFQAQKHYEVENIQEPPALKLQASKLKDIKKIIETKR